MNESRVAAVSYEDLLRFNAELAALVRAGVPLEVGLQTAADSLPARLRRLATALDQRLTAGYSLPDALRQVGGGISPTYTTVVAAGLRSGRLADALDAVAEHGTLITRLNRQLRLAMIYPTIVVALAYLMTCLMVLWMFPRWQATMRSLGFEGRGGWLAALDPLLREAWWWMPALPLAAVGALVAAGYFVERAQNLRMITPSRWPGYASLIAAAAWLQGLSGVLVWLHLTRVLKLLVASGVPFPQAVGELATIVGESRLGVSLTRVSRRLQSGAPPAAAFSGEDQIPEFVRRMISTGVRVNALTESLDAITELYSQRAESQIRWLCLIVSTAVVTVVGGGAALVYALSLFGPLSGMLGGLTDYA